jgi:ADP-heptose:LPS heptosyltransferase
MRVLFLVPGGMEAQLQVLPAAARVAEALQAQIQVACAPSAAGAWSLLPAMEKLIPFDFNASPTLADWANLLGNVREPDFQACINLASGRQVDLMLSMSHIPNRVARGGFSATDTVNPEAGWPAQAMAAFLRPLGVSLDADAFRLALPKAALEKATTQLPSGQGPALLLAPAGGTTDRSAPGARRSSRQGPGAGRPGGQLRCGAEQRSGDHGTGPAGGDATGGAGLLRRSAADPRGGAGGG